MKETIIWALIAGAGTPILGVLINLFLPNKVVGKWCFGLGRTISALLRVRLGKHWEALEKTIQGTLDVAHSEFNRGLDFDDSNGGNNGSN